MTYIKTLYDDSIKERVFLTYWTGENGSISSDKLIKKNITGKTTLFIGNVKTDTGKPVVMQACLEIYDINKELIHTIKDLPFIVTGKYHSHNIIFDTPTKGHYFTIIFNFVSLLPSDSVTRVLFNRLLYADGNYNHVEYNEPSGHLHEQSIHFIDNFYAELHKKDNTYLQVMRPNYDSITTEKLTQSKKSILAPHLAKTSEDLVDTSEKLCLEYINQKEQTVDLLK